MIYSPKGLVFMLGAQNKWKEVLEAVTPDFCEVEWLGCKLALKDESTQTSDR